MLSVKQQKRLQGIPKSRLKIIRDIDPNGIYITDGDFYQVIFKDSSLHGKRICRSVSKQELQALGLM